jgi:HD-GYP domain-containing protein (c-di-GMP phosphodiesterase class II)
LRIGPVDKPENMRLVATRRLEGGSVLARDVVTGRHGSVPLLRRGTKIDPRYVQALERAGINAVYVEDPISEGIVATPALSEETRNEATRVLERALSSARRHSDGSASLPESAVTELTAVARLIATEISACDDAIFALQDLAAADAYTMQHSIDVTAIGLLIGRRLFRDSGWIDYRGSRRFEKVDERVVQLGLGLILHDVGKLTVPQEILAKNGPLDPMEWELIKRHPMAGLDMLASSSNLSAVARTVIRSHHERWDGSGYPEGLVGTAIHQYARIAAVADVYDAVTSERPYSKARPPHVGWQIIVDGVGSHFEQEVVDTFRRVVAPYPPGSEIVLEDGSKGLVVSVEVEAPEQPLVRVVWDPSGKQITPYELRVDAVPTLAHAA